jgi:hypothetical protein
MGSTDEKLREKLRQSLLQSLRRRAFDVKRANAYKDGSSSVVPRTRVRAEQIGHNFSS